jgi:hypothetical protein
MKNKEYIIGFILSSICLFGNLGQAFCSGPQKSSLLRQQKQISIDKFKCPSDDARPGSIGILWMVTYRRKALPKIWNR